MNKIREERRRPERVALVLSGGVGLGAYQAGAYAGLHEGGPRPDWLAGSSIGAVNAAIIAGAPPESRVERLQRFWDAASLEPVPQPGLLGSAWMQGPLRHAANWMSVLQARMLGSPGLFQPRLPGLSSGEAPSAYDLAPMRALLASLVDFGRLNGGEVRVSVVATDIETGEAVAFDTARGDCIELDHLLATCGFLPEFALLEMNGRLLGDGGLVANAPLDTVLRDRDQPGADLLCFVLDLYTRSGGRPRTLEIGAARRAGLLFANQTWRSLEAFRHEERFRSVLRGLAERLPEGARSDPELAWALADSERSIDLLYLSYQAPAHEAGPDKPFDFSRASLQDRWQAGLLDMREALRIRSATSAALAREPGFRLQVVRR
jgi:NTE family protein